MCSEAFRKAQHRWDSMEEPEGPFECSTCGDKIDCEEDVEEARLGGRNFCIDCIDGAQDEEDEEERENP